MEQKNFYHAFKLLYETVQEALHISQKEELYRRLFKDVVSGKINPADFGN